MLKRSLDLYKLLPNLNMPQIDDFLPDPVAHKKVDTLCRQFGHIVSMKKHLLDTCTKLLNACVLFDGVRDCFPSEQKMHNRLGTNEEIMENSKLKSIIVSIQEGYKHELTAVEKKSVQHLLDPSFQSQRALPTETDFADDQIKLHRPAASRPNHVI